MNEDQPCRPAPSASPDAATSPEVGLPDAASLDAAGSVRTVVLFDSAAPLPQFDISGLWDRQQAEIDEPLELSAAEIEALPLSCDEPPDLDQTPWWLTDEYFGTDEAEHAAWLRGLPADIAAGWRDEPRSDDLPGAGFTHRDAGPGPRPDAGFAAGGVLDGMRPGPVLAAAVHAAAARGGLGESELVGVLCGWQRLVSWAQAGQAACLNALVDRRKEQSVQLRRPALAAHVDAEIAAALALTGPAAARLLSASAGLGRLPGVLAALAAGRVDWAKANLFVDALAGLPGSDASDIAGLVLAGADGRTTGQVRAALARAVLAYDPEAAERKRQAARTDASVQSWAESSGNACLAGRELAPADVIEASARLTGHARWLHAHGMPGSTDELRAAAYVALLTGRPLSTLLPAVDSGESGPAAGDCGSAGGEPAGQPATAGRPGGTINLTMPLSAWLGLTDVPGEVAGHGPADAGTCRDLAARAGPGTRWCLTLTGADGRAVAHACASRPPSLAIGGITWAASLRARLQYLEAGTCRHARRTSRYRPPPSLVHLIRIRQRTCSFPGCRRPARRTDLDHTRPWQHGGDTCECNLAPLCRRHHQAKQAPGWRLEQPQPGMMVWRLPHGRTYTTCAEPYPV